MSGVENFSGFEVIRAAMEVEKNGHRFYSSMIEKARTELIREVFTWLAQDEIQHLRTLEDLAVKYQDGAFWDDEEQFLPYLNRFNTEQIFPDPAQLESVVRGEDSDFIALDLAIAAEEKFAAYFQLAAEHARTDDGREAFAWLAGEENRHAKLLKERKAKLVVTV